MSDNKWTHEDTAKQTGDSTSKVAAAEHQARDDATKAGLFERGNSEVNSKPFSKTDESGSQATSLWNSIFGSKK